MSSLRRLTHDDYTVACICPMGVELAPLDAMLDEPHQSLPSTRDETSYTLGRMGAHNVVIAVMPEIGNNSAVSVATQLMNDFKSIRFGLLVGIGGGIPDGKKIDIRLGDVVVSKPTAIFEGVVQFDRGKAGSNGRFERTGTLQKPPKMLMATVEKLAAEHRKKDSDIPKLLTEMLRKFPKMEEQYIYQGEENDQLFAATYIHHDGDNCPYQGMNTLCRYHGDDSCRGCDARNIIKRVCRTDLTPRIHYGTIGSSNIVVKDSVTRERLKKDLGILCVEMEAAGLMDTFPCLVIRGICDYADSHKNKRWQPYAAATAAAYARELLSIIPAHEVIATTKAADARQISREQDRLLNELPYADGAAFNSRIWEDKRQCLPETRVDLLKQITTWSENPSGPCIFWLNGMAGTGKSTIARTVAFNVAQEGRLGASFFFSRGQGDLGHAGKFVTSIAAQLARAIPALKSHTCGVIVESFKISKQGLREQWKHLILQPLSNLKDESLESQIFLVVIDALDECEGEDDVRLILQLLAEAKALGTVQLRVFVTSRPETPIHFGFLKIPKATYQDFELHNISTSTVEHDITIFLYHELEIIREEQMLPEDWPGEHNIELLTRRVNGLFIYIATACRFIRKSFDPDLRLSIVLQGDSACESPIEKLDDMYTQVLEHLVIKGCNERENAALAEQFRYIVGSIVILFDTLTTASLAKLLCIPINRLSAVLRPLRSFLDVPESQERRIQLLHPSFHDFLLDQRRCPDRRFWICEKMAHNHAFTCCLKLMSKHLKRDICNLKRPGTLASEIEKSKVEKCLPPDVQYACRYWVNHLLRTNVTLYENGQVHDFLKEHLLHWLEALSAIGKISEGAFMIAALQSRLTVSTVFSIIIPDADPVDIQSREHTELYAIVHDAWRFIFTYGSIIETAPYQVYTSALIFSPVRSVIRNLFLKKSPTWIKSLPLIERDWSPSLQTLVGHSGLVRAVAFSPDGQLIASGSDDKTIRLWDPATGAAVQTLEGHSGSVWAVAFSPDGQLLASGSYDKTIRLWDPATGAAVQTLEGHSGLVFAVAFSPDGQLLASGSYDKTIRLWDPATGAAVQTLEGHSGSVCAVAFSPDGQLLASGSHDKTIRLWDPATGAAVQTLEGHSGSVCAVAFSPDGQLLASGSYDNTIRLWDPATGAAVQTLEGHSDSVWAVAFSPDGQLLASGSYDETIRLWDPATGAAVQTLEGHSDSVWAVAFSPDGQLLASGSDDKTIRLWDPATGAAVQTLEGHSDLVWAVAFSPDGQLLASGSDDKTIRLWDPATGAAVQTLEGHSDSVCAVAFSPDGQLLASGSHDETIRLWDPATGAAVQTLEGHSDSVWPVAFSPDGQLLASGSDDKTIRLWDPATGAAVQTLEGHSDSVWAVAFSPDGQLLASGSYDKTIRLWDPATGAAVQTLEGHSGSVWAVAFSPDGQLLASGSYDKTIRLWDPATGAAVQTLEGHSDSVCAVAFSPDGQLLASGSDDKTIRLWDPATGVAVQTLESHWTSVQTIFTSPYSLDTTLQWVTWKTHNILLLPFDRRPTKFAVKNNILTMGSRLGQVTFLEFESDINDIVAFQ